MGDWTDWTDWVGLGGDGGVDVLGGGGLGLSALGRPLMGDVRGVLRDDVHPAQSEERGGGEEVFVVRVDFREAIFRGGC